MRFHFIFDYRSPYAYLANTQLKTLPQLPDFIAVDIVSVMDVLGNQPSPKCPAKARYSARDAARWAALYGVPFGRNTEFMQAMQAGKVAADILSRAACAAQDMGVFEPFHDALFSAYWGKPLDLVSAQGRHELLRNARIDQDVWGHAESSVIREKLQQNTAQAIEYGVFGVPFFLVDDEPFFGNDRLGFVKAALLESRESNQS